MRAGYVPARGVIEVGDFPEPRVEQAGDVIVQVSAASICGSDLKRVFSDVASLFPLLPGQPGHEGVGRVTSTSSDRFREGDLVLLLPAHDGARNRCFAEFMVISEKTALPLPEGELDHLLMGQQVGT